MRINARLLAMVTMIAIAACASTNEGARKPPPAWAAISPSGACETLSGIYAIHGEPAPNNSAAQVYNEALPIDTSLDSLIQGARTPSLYAATAVRIEVDSAGRTNFSAQDARGESRLLPSSEWRCSGVSLMTQTTLSIATQPRLGRVREELQVRLWKNGDGALIAEETIVSVERHLRRSSLIHRPLARLYFRFPALAVSMRSEVGRLL